MMISEHVASILVLLLTVSDAFSIGKVAHPANAAVDRRECLAGIVSSVFGAAVVTANPFVARADVSDGNSLPLGAAQFSRVLQLQSDLKVR